MPSPSGSGKSTLCAGLVNRGWRLLSDELAVLDPADGMLVSIPRPVSLKNASIEIIREFAPAAPIGAVVHDTVKGSVAHMQPPPESVNREHERARPRWVVLPRYTPESAPRFVPLSRARAFMHLLENAFNFDVHGAGGFDLLAGSIDQCESFEFHYSRLEDAAIAFDRLAGGRNPGFA
jgi:HprK-related kinase A